MKKTLFTLFLFLPLLLAAQTEPRSPQRRSYNNVFAEAWGVTGWYSVNYERIFWRSKRNVFMVSASVGYSNLARKGVRHVNWPMRLMLCVGKKNLYGEVGYDLIFNKSEGSSIIHGWTRKDKCNYLHAGIRYQPMKSGLYLRAYVFAIPLQNFAVPLPYDFACSGIFYHLDRDRFDLLNAGKKNLWWGGVGIGWSFGP